MDFRSCPVRIKYSMIDYMDYKNLSKEELDYILNGSGINKGLMNHQLISLVFAVTRNRVAYFHGIGTGKTLTALETLKLWKRKRVLVVCPVSAFDAWERDIKKFTTFSYKFIIGSHEERLKELSESANVSIINYDGLKCVYANFAPIGGGKKKWVLDPAKMTHDFDCIVLDEIHRCSAYTTLQSSICVELSRRTGMVVGMTGTPVDKSLLDLFNIYYTLDLGKSLGNSFFAYRSKYFNQPKFGYEWKIKNGKDVEILNRLRDSTISFERNECFDLPELQEVDKWLDPSSEFKSLQDDIIDGLPIHIGDDWITVSNDSQKVSMLRQLSSGFIYYKTEFGEYSHVLKENPKLNTLIDVINGTGSKIIIFHQFIKTSEIIQKALDKNHTGYVVVNGGQSNKDRINAIRRFTTDSSIGTMIAHPACASEGFDGTVANVVVFFDPIASTKIRDQCIGRVYRKGQKEKSLVINLLLKRSVDKTTVDSRNGRSSLVKSVMKFIHEYHS